MTSGMACHTLTVEFRRRVLPRQVAEKIGCSRESLRKEIAPGLTAEIDATIEAAIGAWDRQRGVDRSNHHARMAEIDPRWKAGSRDRGIYGEN